jgi:hypothetical protein
VNKQVFVALSLSIGLGLAFSSASCGPTCPAGQQSCGSDAGASSTEVVTCDLLTQFSSCMTSYCKTASNPFCTCWNRGFDVQTSGDCACIPFDKQGFCDQAKANGIDATTYDCAADSSRVSSICVTVN